MFFRHLTDKWVPANKMLLAGSVLENNMFFAGGVPTNKMLLAGRLPQNDVFFCLRGSTKGRVQKE